MSLKSASLWTCHDCGTLEPEYHMVHAALWTKMWGGVDPPYNDPKDREQPLQLCFACEEARLGRPITREDLTTAPINEMKGWLQDLPSAFGAGTYTIRYSTQLCKEQVSAGWENEEDALEEASELAGDINIIWVTVTDSENREL